MNEVKALREALARLHRGRGVRYTAAMRARVARVATALRSAGRSFQSIGKELGIPHETIRRFCTKAEANSVEMVEAPVFRPVAVALEPRGSALVLVTVDGHRIEGGSAADIVTIVRGLR